MKTALLHQVMRKSFSSSNIPTCKPPPNWTCAQTFRRLSNKFRKAEVLPLKEKLGGYRFLFSHNVEFELRPEMHSASITTLAEFFPALARLKTLAAKKVDLVNHTIVEEVLQDLGVLHFGKGVVAKANAALWRERGNNADLLIGEFSFECKFKRRNELNEKVLERVQRLLISLQEIAGNWILARNHEDRDRLPAQRQPPHSHYDLWPFNMRANPQ